MKKFIAVLFVAAIVLTAAGSSIAAEKVTTVNIGIGLNDKHPQYHGLLKFKEAVEEKTGGRYVVRINHSGVVGDDRAMMEMLQLGTLQGTCPSSAVAVNFVREFAIFDFPYLFPSTDAADAILGGELGRELLDKLSQVGIKGMNYWELGFLNITNSRRPITKLEDFDGLKIRTMENQVHLDTLRAFGCNPTPMAFSELFTAMQQKTVDGQQNPESSIYNMRFYEVQPYMTLTRHVYGPFIFMLSGKFWDQLSDADKTIFQEAADLGMAEEKRLVREENARLQEQLAAEGMQIDELAPEEREKMLEKVKPVIEKHSAVVGEELVKKMYEAVNALK